MSAMSVWYEKINNAKKDIHDITKVLVELGHRDPDDESVGKDKRVSAIVLLDTYRITKKRLHEYLSQPLSRPVQSPDDDGQLCIVGHVYNAIVRLDERIDDLSKTLKRNGYSIDKVNNISCSKFDELLKSRISIVEQVLLATLGRQIQLREDLMKTIVTDCLTSLS